MTLDNNIGALPRSALVRTARLADRLLQGSLT